MSSCVPYHKLIKKESPQATELDDQREVAYNNVRTAAIYNQFETRALFNFLRMSDATRRAYADVYCGRRGIAAQAKEEFLKRQLEENNHWYSFIVLADIRDKTSVSLGEKNAQWTFSLDLGTDKTLVPESIKEIDVEPEQQHFFGHRFNLFKTAYLIKFPRHDASGQEYTSGPCSKVIVSSPYKKAEVVWDEKDYKKKHEVRKDEDFYWG
jgi:hypothetical protein